MIKKHFTLVALSASILLAAEGTSPILSPLTPVGPRMAVAEVQGTVLKGVSPKVKEGSFRILNGSTVLWEGKGDTAFELDAHGSYLYFVSDDSNNLAWQHITWEKGKNVAPCRATETVIEAARHGLTPETEHCGLKMRELIDRARERGNGPNNNVPTPNCTISLVPGEYHFYPEDGLEMSLYISNHDQQKGANTPVGIPLVNLKGVTLEGNGSHFIFHGNMLPFLMMDSRDVTCNNIRISYATPFAIEGKIIKASKRDITLSLPPDAPWGIKDGIFHIACDRESLPVEHALAFEENGIMAPTGKKGDIPLKGKAAMADGETIRIETDPAAAGLHVGQTLVLRSYARPHPAMLLYRSHDTRLNNIVFHDSQGMGLLAQRCENVTIHGGGCLRAKGRMHTVAADATHFSNCRGLIHIEKATYEGMMDDAINVHATCLRIERIEGKEITVRYMHPQAIGFEVFKEKETLRFIHSKTLENDRETAKVVSVSRLSQTGNGDEIDGTLCKLTLDAPPPPGIGVGDAVENADWHPSVEFIGNIVRHNRARGALFTTSKPVKVANCTFDHCHGSAILLAGDAQGWYESGSCQGVEITGNTFDHNLTARYQFAEAIISIYPEIREPNRQKQRYHHNIRICNNRFTTHKVPLLYARSVDGLKFTGNRIFRDEKYPPLEKESSQGILYCSNVEYSQNTEEKAPPMKAIAQEDARGCPMAETHAKE